MAAVSSTNDKELRGRVRESADGLRSRPADSERLQRMREAADKVSSDAERRRIESQMKEEQRGSRGSS